MVTRCFGGRLAGEPQRRTLAQADQQRPARQLRNLAGYRGTRNGPATHGAFLNRGRPAAHPARTMPRPQQTARRS